MPHRNKKCFRTETEQAELQRALASNPTYILNELSADEVLRLVEPVYTTNDPPPLCWTVAILSPLVPGFPCWGVIESGWARYKTLLKRLGVFALLVLFCASVWMFICLLVISMVGGGR